MLYDFLLWSGNQDISTDMTFVPEHRENNEPHEQGPYQWIAMVGKENRDRLISALIAQGITHYTFLTPDEFSQYQQQYGLV